MPPYASITVCGDWWSGNNMNQACLVEGQLDSVLFLPLDSLRSQNCENAGIVKPSHDPDSVVTVDLLATPHC
jgi:hypothetical protein